MLIVDFRSSLEVATRFDFVWQGTGQEPSLEIGDLLALNFLHEAGVL